MIKLTFALVWRAEFTRESFQAHWFNHHAPLVASVRQVLRIRRYVQAHAGSDAMNAGIGASRQAPPDPGGSFAPRSVDEDVKNILPVLQHALSSSADDHTIAP